MDRTCKKCGSNEIVKSGRVRGKQRYCCKACGINFVEGDERAKASPEAKVLAALLYSSGKASFGFLAKLFNVTRTTTLRWIRELALSIPEPHNIPRVPEIEFDEMWHFLQKKLKSSGYGEHFAAQRIAPLPGFLVVVMWRRFENSTTKSLIPKRTISRITARS